MIFPGRWFLLFHLLPFDKHDVRLGKAIFINVSFPFLQARCRWSMNYDQPGRQASFQERILSPLRSRWCLWQKWLDEKSLYVCWPITCPRVYQVAHLCSFLKANMTRVFFPSCFVANIGKFYCGRLPFPPTIPVASTIYVTPYLNNKLLLVIFLMVNNFDGCWGIIFISVADQQNLWVFPTAAVITALLRTRGKEHEVAPNTAPLTVSLLHSPWNSSPLHIPTLWHKTIHRSHLIYWKALVKYFHNT